MILEFNSFNFCKVRADCLLVTNRYLRIDSGKA